jgi:ABC-type lipoprotein export system ATPase subunit
VEPLIPASAFLAGISARGGERTAVPVALEASGLAKRVDRRAVLAGIDLRLHAGETAALVGPSGSGKTTLLSILGCILKPDAGELRLGGQRVPFDDDGADWIGFGSRRVGLLTPRPRFVPFMTIEENLIAMAVNGGLVGGAAGHRVRELLVRFGLAPHLHKFPAELGVVQLRRSAIAGALLHRPAVLLADDPTSGLPSAEAENVVRLLIGQARFTAAALFVVTHDPGLLPRFDRVFTLEAGSLREHEVRPRPRSAEPLRPARPAP